MSAKILTIDAAKAANIAVIENRKHTQTVHDVVVAMRAARRSGTASVKTKATVNLSGKKPWKQKGTGRARAGYASSPVWVGGGVVFGPHPRSYAKKVSKQTKRLGLRKALSERIKTGDIFIVDQVAVSSAKTKDFVAFIKSVTPEAKVLVVSAQFDEPTFKAARNVKKVQLARASDVNTEELLAFRKIILTNDALTEIAGRINK